MGCSRTVFSVGLLIGVIGLFSSGAYGEVSRTAELEPSLSKYSCVANWACDRKSGINDRYVITSDGLFGTPKECENNLVELLRKDASGIVAKTCGDFGASIINGFAAIPSNKLSLRMTCGIYPPGGPYKLRASCDLDAKLTFIGGKLTQSNIKVKLRTSDGKKIDEEIPFEEKLTEGRVFFTEEGLINVSIDNKAPKNTGWLDFSFSEGWDHAAFAYEIDEVRYTCRTTSPRICAVTKR